MSLSDVEIAQVVGELAPRLAGAPVGKAWLRDEQTLVVEVGRDRLLLAAHPRASRLHLEPRAPAEGSGAPAGATAVGKTRGAAAAAGARAVGKTARGAGKDRHSMTPAVAGVGGTYHVGLTRAPAPFAMAVRRRLGGQRVASLTVLVPGERIVVLEVGPSRERLVAELTGPHANLFLVGPDGTIAAALRRSSSTTRALTPGHPYTAPPPAPDTARWRGRARFGEPPGVTARIASHYTELLHAAEEAAIRERAAVALRREIERLSRRERALVSDLERVVSAAGYRKQADLLLAHAHELPGRGARSVVVPDDFEDGSPLTITLDPALDVRQNATRLYRQHKRLTAGKKHVDARLAQTRAALEAARDKLLAIPSLPLENALALAPQPTRPARRAEAEPRLPYREYASAAGDVIWVGRGGADNDALTFRHARGGDLWLHCRDAAGAHVVVPLRAGPAKDETVLDAATLAAHFSSLRGEAQVDVMVTHVKHLRRPRGAPPGRVFVSETRTIRVRLEPDRLARLLARTGDS